MPDAPINLNRARKARARLEKTKDADRNAVKFGRTKADKLRDAAQATLTETRLDAHRRDRPDRSEPQE